MKIVTYLINYKGIYKCGGWAAALYHIYTKIYFKSQDYWING